MARTTKESAPKRIRLEENHRTYYCTSCGKEYLNQKKFFPASQSSIHASNNKKLTICYGCFDKIFDNYLAAFNEDEEAAVKRMCEKFDYYWHIKIFQFAKSRKVTTSNVMRLYISALNMSQFKAAGKTYDNTHDEEEGIAVKDVTDVKEEYRHEVTSDVIDFWGKGYLDEEYVELQNEYNSWISRYECQTKAQEKLFQNLSLAGMTLRKAYQVGDTKAIKETQSVYQTLMSDANIKPSQRNDNAMAEQNTFGTLIKKWEDEEPIPEADPEFQDVDGIRKYVTVWFFGHLCSMLGIKNKYAEEYDEYFDELKEYTVERPSYYNEEDDNSSQIAKLFEENVNGGDGDG